LGQLRTCTLGGEKITPQPPHQTTQKRCRNQGGALSRDSQKENSRGKKSAPLQEGGPGGRLEADGLGKTLIAKTVGGVPKRKITLKKALGALRKRTRQTCNKKLAFGETPAKNETHSEGLDNIGKGKKKMLFWEKAAQSWRAAKRREGGLGGPQKHPPQRCRKDAEKKRKGGRAAVAKNKKAGKARGEKRTVSWGKCSRPKRGRSRQRLVLPESGHFRDALSKAVLKGEHPLGLRVRIEAGEQQPSKRNSSRGKKSVAQERPLQGHGLT